MRLSSSTGEDPFAKIKTLISDMFTKLEEDDAADANHKAYCEKEMAETKQKNRLSTFRPRLIRSSAPQLN